MTDIVTLHREGRLLEDYPLVAPALAGLTGRELERAGNLLASAFAFASARNAAA